MSLTEEVWPRTGRDPRRDDLPGILVVHVVLAREAASC